MKEETTEKLGTREVLGIIMIMLILKSTDTTPILLFKGGLSAGWIVTIISGLVIMIPLLCTLTFLKGYKDRGFIEVVYHVYGKYIGTAIGLMLFYIIFAALVINTRSYVDIMSSNFFTMTPNSVLYALLMIASCYIAYLGINVIGRTAWVFIPMLQFVTLLIVVFAEKHVNLFFIFPIAGPGVIEILKLGFVNVTTFADILYLSVIFPMVKGYKEFKKANLWGYAISVTEFVIMMIVYVITFGYPSIIYLNYPLQELTRYARFGDYFTHPEAFFLGFWIISAVIRFSAQLYFSAVTMSRTFKIKEYRQLLYPLSAVAVALGMLPENFISNVFFIRRELFEWTWPVALFLPISLWAVGKVKGEI